MTKKVSSRYVIEEASSSFVVGAEVSAQGEASFKGARGSPTAGAAANGSSVASGVAAAEEAVEALPLPERATVGGHVASLLSHADEPIRETAASAFEWLGAPTLAAGHRLLADFATGSGILATGCLLEMCWLPRSVLPLRSS